MTDEAAIPRPVRYGLAAGWVVLIAGFAAWLAVDQRPLSWDESIHYMNAVGYARTLSQPAWSLPVGLLYLSDFYPPLHEFLLGAVFLLTGPSEKVAAAANLPYLLGITLLLLLLGRRLFTPRAGLLAGWLFLAAAEIGIQSKFPMLDLPLTFWVLLGFWTALRSEGFIRRREAWAYGAVLGLAVLVKWSAVFFLVLPPLAAGLGAHRRGTEGRTVLGNLLRAFGVAAVLAAPWYLVHLVQFLRHAAPYLYSRGVVENDPSLLSPASWTYYAAAVAHQASWPLAAVLALGVVLWLFSRPAPGLWLLWLGAPYLWLTLLRNKDIRYTLPLLPLLCLLAAGGLERWPERTRRAVWAAAALFAGAHFAYVHLGPYAGPVHAWLSRPIAGIRLVPSFGPDPKPWPLARVLRDAQELVKAPDRGPVLRVIPDHPYFNPSSFRAVQAGGPETALKVSGCTDWPAFTDLAVTKTGGLGPEFSGPAPRVITDELAQAQHRSGRRFELVRRYPLPDGSEALLYARASVTDPGPSAKVLDELHVSLERLLDRYLRAAQGLSLEITPFTTADTLAGRFRSVRLSALSAELGDFAHKPLGVRVRDLDVELTDLTLDLDQARGNTLVPYAVGSLKLHRVRVDAEDLNRSLAEAGGEAVRASVTIRPEGLHAEWRGRPHAAVDVALKVVPDANSSGSENLSFRVRRLRVWALGVPGWLVQPLLGDFNPLLRLGGFPGLVELGEVRSFPGGMELGKGKEHENHQNDALGVWGR